MRVCYLDVHLVEEVSGVTHFVVGLLELRLQPVRLLLALLQLPLHGTETSNGGSALTGFLVHGSRIMVHFLT